MRCGEHLLVFFATAENFPTAVIPDRGISQKSVRSFAAQTMNREDAGFWVTRPNGWNVRFWRLAIQALGVVGGEPGSNIPYCLYWIEASSGHVRLTVEN